MSLDQLDLLYHLGLLLLGGGVLSSLAGRWVAYRKKQVTLLVAGLIAIGVGIACEAIAFQAWASV